MKRRLLCNTILGASNSAGTMRAMALPVQGTGHVAWAAGHRAKAETFKGGYGPTTKVTVRCADSRVRYINVRTRASSGRIVLLVEVI